MYLSFYNLKKQPFHITPDPEFLYLSPSHKEALAAIIYGIEQRKGFIAIVGAVGVGKTTILRSYLESAERKHLKIIYVFNAKLTFNELLKTIYQELGLPVESNDVLEMVNKLYEVLIEEYKKDNTVILIIDEAQNMPVDTLESLRMLSNLETSKDKLIQIVLVGQPEFEEQLNLNRLRQLKQRLAIRSTILPLTPHESIEYIRFRLQKAGSNPGSVFSPGALKTIVRRAKGIPRVLNILCDNALITGFGYRKKPVSQKITKEIIRDFEGLKQSSTARWWVSAVSAMILLFLGGTVWLALYKEADFDKISVMLSRGHRHLTDSASQPERVETPAARDDHDTPAQSLPPKGETPPPAVNDDHKAVTKTVVRGDTLSKLAQEVYGNSDTKVLQFIRKSNPQIADPNLILRGSTITFPTSHKQEE
ncbi:MAG TPA: AAA family ATPase [Syntrophorhabdaceae bacterium]|nr:AAA family ATPase [Syntrophorhabdaceae bacterium]